MFHNTRQAYHSILTKYLTFFFSGATISSPMRFRDPLGARFLLNTEEENEEEKISLG